MTGIPCLGDGNSGIFVAGTCLPKYLSTEKVGRRGPCGLEAASTAPPSRASKEPRFTSPWSPVSAGREAVEVVGVVSLGTVPAGTTEAQVDDMMMVLEVADEATPAPNPVTTRTASQLQSLLYNIGVFSLSLSHV